MASYYEEAQKLAAALPPANGSVPTAARTALTSRLKGATPGRHSTAWWAPDGAKFRDIFFPNYLAAPYTDQVSTVMGLDDGWWSSFSVAALCQAMKNLTSSLSSQLLGDKINGDVNYRNSGIQQVGYKWYGYVLSKQFAPFLDAVAAVPSSLVLAQTYSQHLNTSEWVLAKMVQYDEGNWPDQYWELYNHWAKLMALGLSTADINQLIKDLIAKGLSVPDAVSADNWLTYRAWLNPQVIDWQDLRTEANDGILREVCQSIPGSMFPSCMKEENSFEFTANSQPGNSFREAPGGSCFTPNTLVLMADDTTKPIAAVKRGDRVRTPQGTALVELITRPARAGRSLVRLTGTSFGYTANHPWLTYEGLTKQISPRVAVANPVLLMDTVPTFSALGITQLTAGVTLAGYVPGQGVVSCQAPGVEVYLPTPADEVLYDLVVEMGASGVSEYIVGELGQFYAVSSEVPRFNIAPLAAAMLMQLFEQSWPVIETAMNTVPPEDFNDKLFYTLYVISSKLIFNALSIVQQAPAVPDSPSMPRAALLQNPQDELRRIVESFLRSDENSVQLTAEFDDRRGRVFEMMAMLFFNEIRFALDLGWRRMTIQSDSFASILAVSILTLELAGPLPNWSDPAQLTLQLISEALVLEEKRLVIESAHEVSGYYYCPCQVVYFSNWRSASASEKQLWTLKATVSCGATAIPAINAELVIPQSISGGYWRMPMPLYDQQGQPVGRLSLDLRPFTPGLLVAEVAARSAWQPADAEVLMHTVAPIAGATLSNLFPNVLAKLGSVR